MDDHTIKLAAGWIYKKKDGPDWWTPLVLTEANPDASAPRYSTQDAFRIFEALKEKDFLKSDGKMDLPDGGELPRFTINWAKLAEFKKFATLSLPERTLPEWLLKFLIAWKTLLVAAGILIATAFFQSIFGKFGEDFYGWLKALFK